MTNALWVCVNHGLPEGTCETCSVVETCPDDRMFTPNEVALALKRARDVAYKRGAAETRRLYTQ